MSDELSLDDDLLLNSQPRSATESYLTEDDIIAFCFPLSIEHPRTTQRLYVLAQHGPVHHHHSFTTCLCRPCQALIIRRQDTDQTYRSICHDQVSICSRHALVQLLCPTCRRHCVTDVHLAAGRTGRAVVTDHEISVMGQIAELTDLISIYFPSHYLSYTQSRQFAERIPKRLRSYPNLTRTELITFLKPLFNHSPHVEFNHFSAFVLEHRRRTLRSMANVDYVTLELIKEQRLKLARRRPVMIMGRQHEDRRRASATDIVQLLHRYSWQITDRHNRHAAAVNVRVVLDRPPDSFYQWDGNFVQILNATTL